ncbi:ornithine carbamoyltransferase [Peptoniphilus sp.]|uniref:ornithine carbamoyltransferase n=1 Tax=Peptoniphilus sp. TaxID=1971214 RepID=UPI003993B902
MPKNFRGKNYLKLIDFTSEDMRYLLDLAKEFKALKRAGVPHKYLEGKNIVLLFEKTSTRTRCSFEVAGYDLGMGVTYLDPQGSQMGHKESIKDTARVLGRMYDGIEYRGFKQSVVEELAEYAGVPVWNGLTDEWHPTQMLADLLTIEEHFGYLKGLKFVYMGDARNNVANSLMIACAKMGVNFVACAPEELFPEAHLVEMAKEIAKENFCTVELISDVKEGTKNADVLYTDIWVSMGEPAEIWKHRIDVLHKYQINKEVMENANEKAIFLHCLPSFHDTETKVGKDIEEKFGLKEMEVSNEVFESRQSLVFDQAENRMHTIKAIVYATLC